MTAAARQWWSAETGSEGPPWPTDERPVFASDTDPRTNGHVTLEFSDGSDLAAQPFAGLTHDEVLRLEFAEERHLVEGLVEHGVVGTIAGLPETHKSWVAQALAVGIARGEGEILGCAIVAQGPVGYFWQDDSRRNETERIQTYERVHASGPGLPVRWFLNEGLELDRDTARLRATIEHYGFVLVVLDSFYNVASGIDLKERSAGLILGDLKTHVADATGCTIVVVDHMPWATDTNRSRLRSYGDVFKNAVTRFGIYIDAEGKKLFVEARGNNVRGFKRTPAYWDSETLELRLVDSTSRSHEERVDERTEKVLEWLRDNPGSHSTTAVREAVGGRQGVTDQALEALKARAEVKDHGRDGGPWSGENGVPRFWIAAIHAGNPSQDTTAALFGPRSAEVETGATDELPRPPGPTPFRGAVVGRAEVEPDEIERLAALAEEAGA